MLRGDDDDDDELRDEAADGADFRAGVFICVLAATLFGFATRNPHFCLAAGGYTLVLHVGVLLALGEDGRAALYAAYGRLKDKSWSRTHYDSDTVLDTLGDYDHFSGAQVLGSIVFTVVWLVGTWFILRYY